MQNLENPETVRAGRREGSQLEILQTAIALQKNGELEKALKLYCEVLDINPENFDALHMSAVIARNMKSYAKAEECFKMAIDKKKDFAPLYLNYGLLLIDLKRFDEAIIVFEKAVMLKIDYVEVNRAVFAGGSNS